MQCTVRYTGRCVKSRYGDAGDAAANLLDHVTEHFESFNAYNYKLLQK